MTKVTLANPKRSNPVYGTMHRSTRRRPTRSEKLKNGSGAAGLTRTDDLTLTKRLLYQLSYSGGEERVFYSKATTPKPSARAR